MSFRVRTLLADSRLPIVAALTSVLLSIPVLRGSLLWDDYLHRAAILGSKTGWSTLKGDVAHLYTFGDGNPQHMSPIVEAGFAPWWGDPEARVSFFRPLGAIFQRIDYALWPDRPALMHAQSLAWLLAVVLAAGAFYRRLLGPVPAAGVAVLLFALDDVHTVPAFWIAQRNMLLAVFFGTLALIAYHRSRAERWRPGTIAGPVLFVTALLSGEAGVGALAYLLAHAAFIDRDPWKKRIASLLPYLAIVAVWRLATTAAGFGVAHVDSYIDPTADPVRFLAAVAWRSPILLLGLLSPMDAVAALLGPPGTAQVLVPLGLVVTAITGAFLWPLLRRDPLARFFAAGTVLSVVPVCATDPANRLLMWSALGAMGLLARFLSAFLARDAAVLPSSRRYRLAAAPFALAVGLIHLVAAPVHRTTEAVPLSGLDRRIYIQVDAPTLPRESVVVVNGPMVFAASHLQLMQAAAGRPVPGHLRMLAPSGAGVHVDRPDERTLVLRPAGGYLAHPIDRIYCSRSRRLPIGYRVVLSDVTIEVISATTDGRPSAIACHFHVPLEDASLRWMWWEKGRYKPWTPPAVHGTGDLPTSNL